jgi:hypothetical protein
MTRTPSTAMPGLTSEPALTAIIPPGETATFRMGSTDEELEAQSGLRTDGDYYTDDEQPAHEVKLTVPFAIGTYEVTNYQYCEVMNWAIEQGYAKIDGNRLTDSTGTYTFLSLNPKGGTNKAQTGIRVQDNRLEAADKKGRRRSRTSSAGKAAWNRCTTRRIGHGTPARAATACRPRPSGNSPRAECGGTFTPGGTR